MEMNCGPRCQSKAHAYQLLTAITRGNLRQIQLFLCTCNSAGVISDKYGRTCLHVAAAKGKWQVVQWLLEEKHSDIATQDLESGWTALHRALFYGQIHVAILLIAHGASVNVRDNEGLTPLDIAMKDRPPHVDFSAGLAEVYSWGDNSNFTLGHDNEQRRRNPELIESFRKLSLNIMQVSMSKYHTLFLDSTGKVYTCGHGRGGRLGHGNEQTCLSPKMVSALKSEVCIQVSAARDHSLFLMENGLVYSCGLNDSQQLGLFPTPKCAFSPKQMNGKLLKGRVIKGICAQHFHTVLYTSDAVFTFGLNAGQLGHMMVTGEIYVSQPRQVSALNNRYTEIKLVASSEAATVVATTKGEVYILHEYQTRKLTSKTERWLDLVQICVSGGHLDHVRDCNILREQGGTELTILLLNSTGKVYIWQAGDQTIRRCIWGMKRSLPICQIALNTSTVAFVTRDGEGFKAPIPHGRPREALPGGNKDADGASRMQSEWTKMTLNNLIEREQVENIRGIERLANIHRAISIAIDRKSANYTVLQSQPNACLTEIPTVMKSESVSHFDKLLCEADEFDMIHDAVLEVGSRRIAVHKYIVSSRSEYFRNIFTSKSEDIITEEKPTVKLENINMELFTQMLKFIYTDTCDFLQVGKVVKHAMVEEGDMQREGDEVINNLDRKRVSAFEVYEKKRNKKLQEKNQEKKKADQKENSINKFKDMAKRFGVKNLAKRLEAVKIVNGKVHPVYGKHLPEPNIRLDRRKYAVLHDVTIEAEDGVTVPCHKCVLVAKLEYFHSMLSTGWIETVNHETLTLPVPGDILELLLDFLYTDNAESITSCEDPEVLCNVLVVADQLLIGRLKDICEVAITQLLTLKNCCEILEFASIYNARQLKKTCQQFICLNLAALLETRGLDVCSEDTLQELTAYYRNDHLEARMSRRLITPYDDWPDNAYLESLEQSYQDHDVSSQSIPPREEYTPSRKAKAKRRRTRTKSSGDEGNAIDGVKPQRSSERQVSVGSEASVEMDDVIEEEHGNTPSQTDCQGKVQKETWPAMSKAIAMPGKRAGPWNLHYTVSAASPEMAASSTSPTGVLHMASSPGETKDGLTSTAQTWSLRNIMEQEEQLQKSASLQSSIQFSNKKSKVSNKEKRRQLLAQQQQESNQPQKIQGKGVKPRTSSNPSAKTWGSVNKVVKSFKDLMLAEEKTAVRGIPALEIAKHPCHTAAATGDGTCLSWGLPTSATRKPPPRSEVAPVSPTSPGEAENPWQRGGDGGSAKIDFSQIIQDEMDQTETLQRMNTKPLALIQIEEQAIQELMIQYGANSNFDEYISVERVPRQLALPTWAAVSSTHRS